MKTWTKINFLAKKKFFGGLGVCVPWKKFGQKMKNFEFFFDIIDNNTCVHKHVKKNFEIFIDIIDNHTCVHMQIKKNSKIFIFWPNF